MTENQKLREALQKAKDALSLALSDVDWRKDSPTQPVIHKAYNCARQALALPTADHLPDAGKMIETATPAPKPASPSPEQATPRTLTSNRRTECESPNEQQQPCAII